MNKVVQDISLEIIEFKKSHRSTGLKEAVDFVNSVIRKETLCFDKRVPQSEQDRYSFWSDVRAKIKSYEYN